MAGPAKSPTRAFVMALIVPGLGHLYCGRFLLFLVFLALINPWSIYYSVVLSSELTGYGIHNYLVLLFFPAAWIAQAIDAYLMASGRNRAEKVKERRAARKQRRGS